jgi:hypothetical protein
MVPFAMATDAMESVETRTTTKKLLNYEEKVSLQG